MAAKTNSKANSKRAPSDSFYHIKQSVDVKADGINFSYYEIDGLKKISYSGRKNPDGNYSIFEKINDKTQLFEALNQEQFLKKISSIPQLKLINEQIVNKMKKGVKRMSLARAASRKNKSKKGSKKRVVRRTAARKASRKGSRKPSRKSSRKGSRKVGRK